MKPKTSTFVLKCVGCKKIDKRPAAECTEQPFCSCGMPMLLEKVLVSQPSGGKEVEK